MNEEYSCGVVWDISSLVMRNGHDIHDVRFEMENTKDTLPQSMNDMIIEKHLAIVCVEAL